MALGPTQLPIGQGSFLLTGMWGWILLRSPHQGRGHPQPPPPRSKGLVSSIHPTVLSRHVGPPHAVIYVVLYPLHRSGPSDRALTRHTYL